jgi:hypothetical protein
MTSPTDPRNDFDSPWKLALEAYFSEFVHFFFPQIASDIDWQRGYEFLDIQLQQIIREAETGRRFADKLVKVWRLSGEETCVFVHIEIQSQRDRNFAERLFSYYYRLKDRFDAPVVSLAVLADDAPRWQPQEFSQELWGCSVSFRFPTVKLLDYGQQQSVLEESTNPFATVVLAHLKTQETQGNPTLRQETKFALARRLLSRGFERQTVINLLRFIDWLLALPPALETLFWQDLIAFEQENRMPYMLSLERMARDQGREEGRERQVNLLLKQLQRKLGDMPSPLISIIRDLDFDALEALGEAVFDLESPSQVAELLIVAVDPETGQEIVQSAVLLKLVSGCLGDLAEPTQEHLSQLSVQQAQDLAQALWQWQCEADLVAWLDGNSTV